MNEVLLMIVITFIGIECRSVSIYLHHKEKYEIKDEHERTFIDLPDDVVKLLDVDETFPYDQLETQLENLGKNHESDHQAAEPPLVIRESRHDFQGTHGEDISSETNVPNVTRSDENVNTPEHHEYFSQKGFGSDVDSGDEEDNDDDDDERDTSVLRDSTSVNDVEKDNDVVDAESSDKARRHFRFRRDAGYQQWRHSLPGQHEKLKHEEDIEWEEVSDRDLNRAKYGEFLNTAKYVGMTLLSVTFFVFIGYCFIRDPVAFVFAFGSGCPCCIICCPCIRKFTDKYLNVKKIIKDSMNRYMPGMIIKDDGTFDTYEPTGEELAIMEEILDEIMDD